MASIGFSTVTLDYEVNSKRQAEALVGNVFMAILESTANKISDSLAVLVFFQSANKAEAMMADSSEFKAPSGKAKLTVVRFLRRAIKNLSNRPLVLKDKILEDVSYAGGKPKTRNEAKVKALDAKLTAKADAPKHANVTIRSDIRNFPGRSNNKTATGPRANCEQQPTNNSTNLPPNQFKCSVFVSHVVNGATWHDIQSAFSANVAPTLRVYMKPGCSWAHVYFYDIRGVEKAIAEAAAGRVRVCGRPVRVRRRTRKKKIKKNQLPHRTAPRQESHDSSDSDSYKMKRELTQANKRLGSYTEFLKTCAREQRVGVPRLDAIKTPVKTFPTSLSAFSIPGMGGFTAPMRNASETQYQRRRVQSSGRYKREYTMHPNDSIMRRGWGYQEHTHPVQSW